MCNCEYIVMLELHKLNFPVDTESISGWETGARPFANVSENLAGRDENRPGRVEFCIGYIRDYQAGASAKNFSFPAWI